MARIHGRAYGADPAFYAFFRTLETYEAIGENTTSMILIAAGVLLLVWVVVVVKLLS